MEQKIVKEHHHLSWKRARMCKRLRSPGIVSQEPITPAYVAWWAVISIPRLLSRLKIRAQLALAGSTCYKERRNIKKAKEGGQTGCDSWRQYKTTV
jgi:hypothetical protein